MSPFHFFPETDDAGNVSENRLRAIPRDCANEALQQRGRRKLDVATWFQVVCIHPRLGRSGGWVRCMHAQKSQGSFRADIVDEARAFSLQ